MTSEEERIKVRGLAPTSIKIMGRKRTNKTELNNDKIKKIDMNQVSMSAKDIENFISKNMEMDEHNSDYTSDSSIENKSSKEKKKNNHKATTSSEITKAKKTEKETKATVENDKNTVQTEILYKHTDKGPFYVMSENKNIDEFRLCELLKKFKTKDIISIVKTTKDKVRINTKTYTAANSIIKMGSFNALEQFKFYIPNNYVYTDGIIKDVPIYYDEQQLNEMIDSPVPIIKITRLTFWNHSQQMAQPSTTIKITFRSSTIPDNISIMWLLRKVEWFIPKPLFCQSCLTYGHFKKYCPVDKDLVLCRVCAKPNHNTDQICNKTCKHCKTEDHQTAERNCPAYRYQCDIKKIMTIKKITYKEAKVSKMQQNPTPSGSNNTYKRTFADIVATSQEENTHSQAYPSHIKTTTNTTMTTTNNSEIITSRKEKNFIITITKIMENMASQGSTGSNDEVLINIGKELQTYWEATPLPQTSIHNNESH